MPYLQEALGSRITQALANAAPINLRWANAIPTVSTSAQPVGPTSGQRATFKATAQADDTILGVPKTVAIAGGVALAALVGFAIWKKKKKR